MQTYLDLKTNCLQKLGEGRNTQPIVLTSSVKDYITPMPRLLSEALEYCSTAGKYIIKYLEIQKTEISQDKVKRYDLKELAPDFYSLKDKQVFLDDANGYRHCSNYTIEGARYFTVPGELCGTWRIYYNSYPQEISPDIADTDPIEVDPEVFAILPLYICGQILMAEDEDYAIDRLSEFEQRRDELKNWSAEQQRATGNAVSVSFDSWRKAVL